jgi:hypothetical protein
MPESIPFARRFYGIQILQDQSHCRPAKRRRVCAFLTRGLTLIFSAFMRSSNDRLPAACQCSRFRARHSRDKPHPFRSCPPDPQIINQNS